jgi:hypothetical protein
MALRDVIPGDSPRLAEPLRGAVSASSSVPSSEAGRNPARLASDCGRPCECVL